MAGTGIGIGMVLDVLKKSPAFSIHSYTHFSATTAAAAAAASSLALYPHCPSFSSQFFFSGAGIAYCDAAVVQDEFEYISNPNDGYTGPTISSNVRLKTYNVELKPLFSAFGWKTLGLTTLRSLLIFYLPLIEPKFDDDDDSDLETYQDAQQEQPPVDYIVPFKKSVKQICRETGVLTTRRVLERLAVQYVSQRVAWKLLKDLPNSAQRKARRNMSSFQFFFCVSRSTFRGHLLAVAASWLVQGQLLSVHQLDNGLVVRLEILLAQLFVDSYYQTLTNSVSFHQLHH
ncbi:hypothetical protein SUGI_0219330 [Cryptomeria japonica]|nr:hypothetical protein SUGI_0219330 [Cryptomeria japonica]